MEGHPHLIFFVDRRNPLNEVLDSLPYGVGVDPSNVRVRRLMLSLLVVEGVGGRPPVVHEAPRAAQPSSSRVQAIPDARDARLRARFDNVADEFDFSIAVRAIS